MVASPFHHWSAKKNGCLGFQVYIYTYTHMSLIEQSNPFPFVQLRTLHISSPARLDSTIWTFPGAMATEQGTWWFPGWPSDWVQWCTHFSSWAVCQLMYWCETVCQKKPVRDASKLAACVRLSYSVSKVLKNSAQNLVVQTLVEIYTASESIPGLGLPKIQVNFWTLDWRRENPLVAENSAGELKGGNFFSKIQCAPEFPAEFRGNNLRDLTKPIWATKKSLLLSRSSYLGLSKSHGPYYITG